MVLLKGSKLSQMVLAAMFLALAIVLPFLTGQIPQIGGALCPMHIPVILCGFICGPWYALFVGAAAPVLRFFMFGMPPLFPSGLAMCFELAAYGVCSGVLFRILPYKKINVYITLIVSMVFGRLVWGVVRAVLMGLGQAEFGIELFIADGFVRAVPGIILQIILIPILVISIESYLRRNAAQAEVPKKSVKEEKNGGF